MTEAFFPEGRRIKMKSPLHILHLEDDVNDAALVQSTLEAGDIICATTCVQTRDDFVAALEHGGIDLILSDFSLPAFDGLSALEIVRTRWPAIPLILVSGTLGEELAIDSLKSGATDYVLKQRLSRLVPAVCRAMQEVKERVERKLAEEKRKEYGRKLQVLSRRLVEAQETERRHLARELHDEIGQALTVAQLNLQALLQLPDTNALKPRLKKSLEVVERVLEQVHDISLNLRPSILDDLGLEPALRWLTDRQAALVGLQAMFHADPLEQRLDPVIETECFRVAEGALTNVLRHARAQVVTVELRKENGQLHLRVRDDGIGFDVAALREKAMHGASLGLLSMEERAALAGGGLEFTSVPKQGTEVHAWFPLKWQIPQS
jgi:signal transduction histidine kinase